MRIIATAGLTALGLLTATATADAATGTLSEAVAAKRLTPARLPWTAAGGSGTVRGVVTLRTTGPCGIVVAGGTESGATAEIAHGGCLDHYVEDHFAYLGRDGDGHPRWKAPAGDLYRDEGRYWEVTYS